MQDVTADTLALIKDAQTKSRPDLLHKTNYAGFTQPGSPTSGLNAYDLTGPAKKIYPVITPLRNMIPRTQGAVGTATNWRTITSVNATQMAGGVAERQRGGVPSTTVIDNIGAYKGMGYENFVTYEADWAGQSFEDVKADAVMGQLHSLMMYEELMILGGNGTIGLGTPVIASTTDVTTGGFLAYNTEYYVKCIALTLEGYITAVKPNVPNPLTSNDIAGGGSINGQVTRTNANASTTTYGGGSSNVSTQTNVTTANDSNNTHAVACTVTPVPNAVAYAWFIGSTTNVNHLYTITTINSVVMGALNSTGQLVSAIPNTGNDNSVNALVYDGLMSQVANSGNAVISTLATGTAGTGTVLSNDGANGITQINQLLKKMWDTSRLGPTKMFISSQEQKNISAKILQSGSTGAFRMVSMGTDPKGNLVGGAVIAQYLNPYNLMGNNLIDIILHPNMPAGTILFYCDNIPYTLESNVKNPVDVYCRRDYYQIDWPQVLRSYDYGIYVDSILRCFFTPSFGILTNIADG